jgi:hypothetical protein
VLDNDGSFTGFDILIGNPPYVQIQSLPADIKTGLADSGYQTFVKSADLYCLFFERALQLLRPQGQLTFITSNKYYRAAYGEKTRALLARDLSLHGLIDFGDAPVFEAIAYASILMGDKQPPPAAHSFPAHTWQSDDDFNHIAKILHTRGVTLRQEQLQPQGWQLESANALDLLQKLRNIGTPLGEYVKGNFYRGITTGLNEAFILPTPEAESLIEKEPKLNDILKPYIRGKDISRWMTDEITHYIIKLESSENVKHEWTGLPLPDAIKVFRTTYPLIADRLLSDQFRIGLEERSDKGTYFWELRSCKYWGLFSNKKILSTKISIRPTFSLVEGESYTANTSYFLPLKDDAEFILSVLNSKVFFFYAKKTFVEKQGGWFEIQPPALANFPIPPATEAQKAELSNLAQACAAATADKDPNRLQTLETRIDEIVCGLFGVSAEELLG